MSDKYEVCYTGDLISRKEAKALSLKNYFTGEPCKHGHIAQREVCSGQCKRCKVLRTRNWRLKSEDERFIYKTTAKKLPSVEYIKSVLSYDPDSGKVYWKMRPKKDSETDATYKAWITKWANREAGARHYANGYLELRFEDRKLHKVHRIIWKIMTGEDPVLNIDHINGIPWDNRWVNLRQANNQENARNCKGFSKTGFKGVCHDGNGGYLVQWVVEDRNFRKSGFVTAESAARYYDEKVRELFGEFARVNFE